MAWGSQDEWKKKDPVLRLGGGLAADPNAEPSPALYYIRDVLDPFNTNEEMFDPTGYQERRRSSDERLRYAKGAELMASRQPSALDSYQGEADRRAGATYEAARQEAEATRGRRARAASQAYARRGIGASGMAGGAQMQVGQDTQRSLAQLRAGLQQQTMAQALQARQQDQDRYLKQMELAERYMRPNKEETERSESGNILGALGGIFGLIGGGRGGGGIPGLGGGK